MKVVINRDYHNEFSLSVEALKKLVIRKAKCMASFSLKSFFGGEYDPKKFLWEQYYKEALPDFEYIGAGVMIDECKTLLYGGMVYFYAEDPEWKDRTDVDLIELVETMGERVNGKGADLVIVEIPDGIEWAIHGNGKDEGVYEVGHIWN